MVLEELHLIGSKATLATKKQFVWVDNVHSNYKEFTCDIPQGSILGPKLFITYINDICNVSTVLTYTLFTDTLVFFVLDIFKNCVRRLVMNKYIYIYQWLSINKLSINIFFRNFYRL